MSNEETNIGESIKIRREEKKYTISAVSEILDIKQSVVKKIESGELNPDEQLLNKFAKLYGCSVDYLHGERDLQVVEDDLGDTEKLLSQNINSIRKQLDRLDKEVYRYLEIKNQFKRINCMIEPPIELPIVFEGEKGLDITEQFVLLSGVYRFELTPEEADYFYVKLFSPKGYCESIFSGQINGSYRTVIDLDKDNTYILRIDAKANWKIIIDEAFEV
ncbi:helix-turn-helix domain-containing protein [Paenibacillus sp. FSL P4-0502]|uniref:helix-turn-helix domain-containing protein n=1 Tax=Paenibacillus sp. FSL P4-0502 TaxID=2975319 RepID=UPI0030F51A40